MKIRTGLLALTVVAGLLAFHPAAAQAATCQGYVGLTFDDGPSNDHTPAILNALKANGLRATMFNEGQYAAQYPAQVRAQVDAGMWVGNHSYTHPHLIQQSQSAIDSELSRTQSAISAMRSYTAASRTRSSQANAVVMRLAGKPGPNAGACAAPSVNRSAQSRAMTMRPNSAGAPSFGSSSRRTPSAANQ